MTTLRFETWKEFRDRLLNFASLDRMRRRQWWFRGQSRGEDSVCATIDRGNLFKDDFDRERHIEQLLDEFRRESVQVTGGIELPQGDDFELLARHHGLPSPLLDWTTSPWIASFFAFAGAPSESTSSVAIYAVDRRAITQSTVIPSGSTGRASVELLDDSERIRFNRRAIQQRGVFMRVSTIQDPVEVLLGKAIVKFEVPTSQRNTAICDLDEMSLNATTLMYDLDGAARTAALRCKRA